MRRYSLKNISRKVAVIGLTLFMGLGLVRTNPLVTPAQAQEPPPEECSVVRISGTGMIGERDPNILFSTDGGMTFNPTNQAFIVAPETAPMFQYDIIPGTQYVSISADRSAPTDNDPNDAIDGVPQFFRTTFEVPEGCNGATLSVLVHADNVATVFVNGTQIGMQTNAETIDNFQNPPDLFTFDGPFLSGTNTLDFTVKNFTNLLALDFEASICCEDACPNDTEAPVVTCNVNINTLWPPNHNLINVGLTADAVDECDGVIELDSDNIQVFSDERDLEPTGAGNHSPDAKNIDFGTLRLRAEREGDKDGRVYLIIVSATDESGNTGTCCKTVTVTHSQNKAAINSVNAQAAAALAFCEANGTPPPGFFEVGVGAVVGPKQ